MTFDPTFGAEMDQETVEQVEVQYPFAQWNYGDARMKKLGGMDYNGGFFMPETGAPADMTEYGWEKTEWTREGGSNTSGFWVRQLQLAVLHIRKRWEVFQDGRVEPFTWNNFQAAKRLGSTSSRAHVLVVAKGMEELGPFFLTLKGSAGMGFENGVAGTPGALRRFDSVVISNANRLTSKTSKGSRWPRYAFWLPVGANRDAKGQPVFSTVGRGNNTSSVVVPIPLGIPEKLTPEEAQEQLLGKLFVGKELAKQLEELYKATQEWKEAWDSFEATEEQVERKSKAVRKAAESEEVLDSDFESDAEEFEDEDLPF